MTSTDAALIDQLCARRMQINALEAAEVASMLEYVDRARAAGEQRGGQLRLIHQDEDKKWRKHDGLRMRDVQHIGNTEYQHESERHQRVGPSYG